MIRNYLDHEKIPVNIIGGGRNKDYGYLGFSHWSEDDGEIMLAFDDVVCHWPDSRDDLEKAFSYSLTREKATYINLKR